MPLLLYLATLCAENVGESGVKITSTSSRGVPSRVYARYRVMLSFSTEYNGFEGVDMTDGVCSLKRNKTSFVSKEDRLLSGATSKFF